MSESANYTIELNDKEYELNEEVRQRIQTRARNEYSENEMFSCWWKVASVDDAEDSIHEVGDPILVIETEGVIVPWEKLDQLEMEQDTSSFQEFDTGGGSDVDEGNGMRTIKPGDVNDQSGDDSQELGRTHFGVTPQNFEEVPSPDGEQPDRIPAKPREFDEPTLVMWKPENPDIEHTWSAGEAVAPMYNWVEWNVQAKADQPRPTISSDNSHNHWESILKGDDCEVVGEVQTSQETAQADVRDTEQNTVPRKFEEGTAGGNNWSV